MDYDVFAGEFDPKSNFHVLHREQVVVPDLGTEATDGRALCSDCGDAEDARLAPNNNISG